LAAGVPGPGPIPRELAKVNLPDYVIEPPDILLIDAIRVVPKPPYRVEPFDALFIQAEEVLPKEPVGGIFRVEPGGTVNLGLSYGSVRLEGLTLEEAQAAIGRHLKAGGFPESKVGPVGLAQSRGLQAIQGEHLVRPDGKVVLGVYGAVPVSGLTLEEAKAAIESHLSRFLLRPEISLDVSGYNSKVYYVILNLAGAGEQIVRLPVTGNETVLDALAQVGGLQPFSSKKRVWLARPAPPEAKCDQILPVDWQGITTGASTRTNYQILPGDRVFVAADPLIQIDNFLAKLFSPVERIFGITLLGNATVRAVGASPFNNTGNGTGTGGF
jgi:polysaccharide export outer membrane protein